MKSLLLTKPALFDGKKNNIVKYYDNLKWLFSILIYFKMSFESWIFNIITVADYTSVFSVTWSFADFMLKKT